MTALDDALDDLVAASHILATEGVVDSFGHVTIRHPDRPDRFFMSRTRAAELVERADILEFGLDNQPVEPTTQRVFAERIIHTAIYRARPDVMAVCHHHAPAMLPFCITDVPLVPVFHLGATMGAVASWDSQAEFGDTNLLVATEEQGTSLARALGPCFTVLMRGHGVTVAGRSLRELVFRSIYGMRNAETLLAARQLGGPIRVLTPGEAAAAEEFNLKAFATDRAWEQWKRRAG